MPIYKIRGIDVDFPFEAYESQIVYMEKVIQSLQEKCNALLESPTGTGKTLCLLCAALAWRKSLGKFSTGQKKHHSLLGKDLDVSSTQNERNNLPTIIYTSRTHSQLQQVIRELKRTHYRPKMVVLGSREQMCIHRDIKVLRGRAQNNACQSLCKRRACFHHTLVSDYIKNHPDIGDEPFDIEDLVNIGRTHGPCPYYVSRELHKVADILFAPYNYLIERGKRRSLSGIDWSNTVLIFDEAHNLESICADAASFDLPTLHLSACISEAQQCIQLSSVKKSLENFDDKSLDPENFAGLRAFLSELDKRISEVPIESKELGFTRPGDYIYELLAGLEVKAQRATTTIDQAVLLLEEAPKLSESGYVHKTKGTVCRLEGMKDILETVFRDGDKSHAKYYRVHVQESQANSVDSLKGKKSRILSWWCFNPGIAMEEFVKLGVRSVIVTSGTLSPLESFALELHLKFPIYLENPHVVSSSQVWAGVVSTGPSGRSFNSCYRNRDSLEYKQELGNAIVNFARIVPDGLLVFFPSYYLMEQCIESWKNMGNASSASSNTIWERICKNKQPVIEPKQSALFPYSIEDFRTKLNDSSTSGAIFFAVCRGKVSEGLDFADHAGRAVVVTGIPFAMRNDPKIRLKREYLDRQAQHQKEFEVLTGEKWYSQQAARAVNQAIGRVIRHRHDYGAMIFCDERFASQSYQDQMSLWLRPHVKCYPKFGDVVFSLTRFFKEKSISCPAKSELTPNAVTESGSKVIVAKSESVPRAESGSSTPLPAILAAKRGSFCTELQDVIPANRSTLILSKRNYDGAAKPSTLLSRLANKIHTATGQKREPVSGHYEVVDLTSNSPDKCQNTENKLLPCSSKKAKTWKSDSDSILPVGTIPSDGQLRNSNSAMLSSNFSFRNSVPGHCTKEQHISQCEDDQTSVSLVDGKPHVHLSYDMKTEEAGPSNKEKTQGSAFLMQVKEKLSTSEYKEFVGFMRALKLKTMKIVPVLESIIRLFSGNGRWHLLKRFKDYVPVKYRPMYEQHLKAFDAAFGSEDESDRST